MEYNTANIRRQDRLLDEPGALRLLQEGEYGVLSLQAEEGGAYGIPINYVWDGKDSIYLHCAPAGRKLRCIAQEPRVSFCVTGHTHVLPEQFSTEYESIVLACLARTGLPAEERRRALELLIRKYAPEHQAVGGKYIGKSFHRTEIIRLDIQEISGKRKHVKKQ